VSGARAAANAGIATAGEVGGIFAAACYAASALAALAAGDVDAAQAAGTLARPVGNRRATMAQAALASGDLAAARRRADGAVTNATGWFLIVAAVWREHLAVRRTNRGRATDAQLEASLPVPRCCRVIRRTSILPRGLSSDR
jgi:hypothetical protein